MATTSPSDLQLSIPVGTLAGSRSFLLVYCENSLGRAESAAGVRFSDWALSLPSTTTTRTTTTSSTRVFTRISNLSFDDLDAVPYELNGTISWSAPADTSAYLHYGVWLLTRTEYTSSVYEVLLTGSQVNDPTTPEGNVPLGTHQLAFAQTRDLGSNGYAQYLTVIPNRKDNDMVASYNEAGFLSIVDLEPLNLGTLQVESVAFTDVDSVATYIQGQVTWRRQENADYGFLQAARNTS